MPEALDSRIALEPLSPPDLGAVLVIESGIRGEGGGHDDVRIRLIEYTRSNGTVIFGLHISSFVMRLLRYPGGTLAALTTASTYSKARRWVPTSEVKSATMRNSPCQTACKLCKSAALLLSRQITEARVTLTRHESGYIG